MPSRSGVSDVCYLNVFDFTIKCVVGEVAWRKFEKNNPQPDLKTNPHYEGVDFTRGLTVPCDGGAVVYLPKMSKGPDLIVEAGLCAHEASHVVEWLMSEIGEREPSTEFVAYHIGAITQFLLQNLMHPKRK